MNVAFLTPGMVTAEDLYSNNQLIVNKDTVLTDKLITKLEFYSIISIKRTKDTAEDAQQLLETVNEVANEDNMTNEISSGYELFSEDHLHEL